MRRKSNYPNSPLYILQIYQRKKKIVAKILCISIGKDDFASNFCNAQSDSESLRQREKESDVKRIAFT